MTQECTSQEEEEEQERGGRWTLVLDLAAIWRQRGLRVKAPNSGVGVHSACTASYCVAWGKLLNFADHPLSYEKDVSCLIGSPYPIGCCETPLSLNASTALGTGPGAHLVLYKLIMAGPWWVAGWGCHCRAPLSQGTAGEQSLVHLSRALRAGPSQAASSSELQISWNSQFGIALL